MPEYSFRCQKCKKSFAKLMTFSQHDTVKPTCPKCSSRKVFQKVGSFAAITAKKS